MTSSNNGNEPLVTIITLCYNTGKLVLDTMRSIKNQYYKNTEHIIIDDCSKDDSVELINGWIKANKHNCTFICHTENKGICSSVNEALSLSNGKYVFFCGDDLLLPDKIQGDITFLEENPDCAFVHSRSIVRNMATGEETPLYYKNNESQQPFKDFIKGKLAISTVTVVYRRKVFDEVGYYDESFILEDFDMFLRILNKHKIGYRKIFSMIYCRHPGNISATRPNDITADIFRIMKKWSHLPNFAIYQLYRKQLAFYNVADRNKKEALKYLFPSLLLFWRKTLYASLYKFFFVWR